MTNEKPRRKFRDKSKDLIIEQLKKTPIRSLACEKCGVVRSTFYRWLENDSEFAEFVDLAIFEGNLLVNDLSESQLLNLIKDGNLSAIKYWLSSHCQTYANKVEVSGKIKTETEQLNPEQRDIIIRALELASLADPKDLKINKE